jgi:exonuclease SbcC
VLDETCAPLDAQGRALFVECLQKVAERFATILVITHVEELKDLFPFRFEISKTAEGSRVEVIAA